MRHILFPCLVSAIMLAGCTGSNSLAPAICGRGFGLDIPGPYLPPPGPLKFAGDYVVVRYYAVSGTTADDAYIGYNYSVGAESPFFLARSATRALILDTPYVIWRNSSTEAVHIHDLSTASDRAYNVTFDGWPLAASGQEVLLTSPTTLSLLWVSNGTVATVVDHPAGGTITWAAVGDGYVAWVQNGTEIWVRGTAPWGSPSKVARVTLPDITAKIRRFLADGNRVYYETFDAVDNTTHTLVHANITEIDAASGATQKTWTGADLVDVGGGSSLIVNQTANDPLLFERGSRVAAVPGDITGSVDGAAEVGVQLNPHDSNVWSFIARCP
ncbi:MAG: hypothetical protein ACYDDF_12025 [Thermoplasmatota archaeon]